MEIFINSTYSGSPEGYRLLRMGEGSFHEIDSPDELDPSVLRFFSEDLFRALWVDLPSAENSAPYGGFFGIKEIHGAFDNGKSGVINVAFYAAQDELTELSQLVSLCLSNYAAFCSLLFSVVHIENGVYTASSESLLQGIGGFPERKKLRFCRNIDGEYSSAEDVFHFAVCMGSTDRAAEQLSQMCCFPVKKSKLTDEKTYIKTVGR